MPLRFPGSPRIGARGLTLESARVSPNESPNPHLERALHRRYHKHRTHGEWFEAAPVLDDLRSIALLGPCEFRADSPPNRADSECVANSTENQEVSANGGVSA